MPDAGTGAGAARAVTLVSIIDAAAVAVAGAVVVEAEAEAAVAGAAEAAGVGTDDVFSATGAVFPVNALAIAPGGSTLLTLVNSSTHLCTAAPTLSSTLSRSSIASLVTRSRRPNCSSVNVVGSTLKGGLLGLRDEEEREWA